MRDRAFLSSLFFFSPVRWLSTMEFIPSSISRHGSELKASRLNSTLARHSPPNRVHFRALGPLALRTGILLPVALHGRLSPPQFLSATGRFDFDLTGTFTPLRCAPSQSHYFAPTALRILPSTNGNVKAVHTVQVEWQKNEKGQYIPKEVAETDANSTIECQNFQLNTAKNLSAMFRKKF
jgi:hypothetical protein